jgi:hypothetical protein
MMPIMIRTMAPREMSCPLCNETFFGVSIFDFSGCMVIACAFYAFINLEMLFITITIFSSSAPAMNTGADK